MYSSYIISKDTLPVAPSGQGRDIISPPAVSGQTSPSVTMLGQVYDSAKKRDYFNILIRVILPVLYLKRWNFVACNLHKALPLGTA